MKDNVYLIIHQDYTYSVCFATEIPNSNAYFLTEEKEYPVVYCVQSLESGTYRILLCHNREELSFEINRSGKYYDQIHKLWDYDHHASINTMYAEWEEQRLQHFVEYQAEYMSRTGYCSLDQNPDILVYWAQVHYPQLQLTAKESEALLTGFCNTLLIGNDGTLYIDDYGAICSVNIIELIMRQLNNFSYKIDTLHENIAFYNTMSLTTHKVLNRLLSMSK